MAWQLVAAKNIVRLIAVMMIYTAASVLFFGASSWEMHWDPPLSKEKQALIRVGVLFDHGFQLPLWLLCILISELGGVEMLRCALGTIAFAIGFNGVWGLKAFYAPAVAAGVSPDDAIAQAQVISSVIAALALVGFGLTWIGVSSNEGEDFDEQPYQAAKDQPLRTPDAIEAPQHEPFRTPDAKDSDKARKVWGSPFASNVWGA